MGSTTQKSRLVDHFRRGYSITRIQALNLLGIFELSSIIVGLEKSGYIIEKEPIQVTNRFGETANVKRYSVDWDKQPSGLRQEPTEGADYAVKY